MDRRGLLPYTVPVLLLLFVLAALSVIPVIGMAQSAAGTDTVDVVVIYSHGCVACERARPVTAQALSYLNNSTDIKVNYVEYVDNSREGLEYVERYHLNGVPSMVIDGNTIIGPDEFAGDSGVAYNLILQKIRDASAYVVPIVVDRRMERDPSNSTLINVANTIKNKGNESVFLSFMDGEGNGITVTSGNPKWEGTILPGGSVSVAYNATASGLDRAQSPKITYMDSGGAHVLLLPDDLIPGSYSFDPITLLVAGLVAGFNPCIIAILIFIAAEVASATGSKLDIMLNVAVFCLGILAIYLLIGAGLFEAVSIIPSIAVYLEYAVIVILLALAAYAFYNAYQKHAGKAPGSATRSLISSVKPLYTKYRLAGSFLLGGLFGMIKMPCAGGIYLAILSKIVLSKEIMEGAIYLLIFDIGVILPVLALGLVLALGFGTERMDRLRSQHAVLLHVLNGAILALLAAAFLLNII